MIYGVREDTVHGALTLAAYMTCERGEEQEGYFRHDDHIIIEIHDPKIRQTTWGLPLIPALGTLDLWINHSTPPVFIDLDRHDATYVIDVLDFDNISDVVAASLYHHYETRGNMGKLVIVAHRTKARKGIKSPQPPPLGEEDGFDPVWGDKWRRELAMFVREPGAIGYKDRFFRKVAAPVAAGGAVLKTAPASPWVIAARINNEQ